MTDYDDDQRPTNIDSDGRVMTNAELNLEFERKQREAREKAERATYVSTPLTESLAKQLTTAASNGASTSGKSGNKNALRHGGYFPGLLPWESPDDFKALHKKLREDCNPEGALQEEVVSTLCQWTWQRRRVILASEITYFRSPVPEGLKTGELTWDDVVAHQSKVPAEIRDLISTQGKLVEILNGVGEQISKHRYWTDTTEGKDIQFQLKKMRSEIGTLASEVKERAIGETEKIKQTVRTITSLFDKAYQPDEIEKQARLLSMIDREIDKTIKRLIFLKTFASDIANVTGKTGALKPLVVSPPVIPNEVPNVEQKVEPAENAPLRGTKDHPVALAAPEHRGKPKAD